MSAHLPPNLHHVAHMTETSDLNLTTHRAATSVWDKRGWDGRRELAITRWLIGVGGGALLIQGMRQRSIGGSMLAGLGGTLAWWAVAGEGDFPDVRCWIERIADRAGLRREDLILQSSAESFPASDPPSWTPTVGTGLRNQAAARVER
jgi:hypothetical protein